MINLDSELAEEYLAGCREHLAAIETDLLAIEKGGPEIDEKLVNRVFRAVHSIKGGAGFFDLARVGELAHQAEDVLEKVRSREMVPTPDVVGVLLRATDKLSDLIQNPDSSNQADIAEIMAALAGLSEDRCASAAPCGAPATDPADQANGHLRALLVEDDFVSRLLLQTFLSRYGECHVAVNGREAVEASRLALERGRNYDLICMDILMPEMDGREAVRQVRALEESHGILSNRGAKIVMTTTVDDIRDVILCFRELCDAYLLKPIDLDKLLGQMKSYQLVQ
jgi:chemotaxis protein histidine kinase CheA